MGAFRLSCLIGVTAGFAFVAASACRHKSTAESPVVEQPPTFELEPGWPPDYVKAARAARPGYRIQLTPGHPAPDATGGQAPGPARSTETPSPVPIAPPAELAPYRPVEAASRASTDTLEEILPEISDAGTSESQSQPRIRTNYLLNAYPIPPPETGPTPAAGISPSPAPGAGPPTGGAEEPAPAETTFQPRAVRRTPRPIATPTP